MVRLFFWAALIHFAACDLHPYFTLKEDGIKCHQHTLRTPAGTKIVDCKHDCDSPTPGVGVILTGRQCLTVSMKHVKHMTALVNYTCELGACTANNECNPFDLLIGCWKP
uniref:Evasin n=1 Tax=Rhipicephalus zambeziensis TaxID=60191 RepID=A0A224YE88_9ACAR